ncbi:MAG: flippase-like domain-containing protein [Dehalococcoidia bacterium]
MMFRFRNQVVSISLARRIFSVPTLVSVALALAFLAFLVTRFEVDLGATWAQVKSANPWFLGLAFLVHYSTFVFRGARWRLLLRNVQDPDTPVPGVFYCSQLTLLSWFANSVAWFRLGDAYRAYIYHQEQNTSFSRTAGTILAERVLDTMLVVLLLAASLPFILGQGAQTSWMVLGIASVLLAWMGIVLVAIAIARKRVLQWLPSWLAERFQRFHDGALGSFRQLPLVTLWGLLGWLVEIERLYLVTLALGLDLSFALIVFITLANSLLTLVPTPGGLGAVESGVAGVLGRLSTLSAPSVLALILVDRSISYVSIIIVGAGLFLVRQFRRRAPTTSEAPILDQD